MPETGLYQNPYTGAEQPESDTTRRLFVYFSQIALVSNQFCRPFGEEAKIVYNMPTIGASVST